MHFAVHVSKIQCYKAIPMINKRPKGEQIDEGAKTEMTEKQNAHRKRIDFIYFRNYISHKPIFSLKLLSE